MHLKIHVAHLNEKKSKLLPKPWSSQLEKSKSPKWYLALQGFGFFGIRFLSMAVTVHQKVVKFKENHNQLYTRQYKRKASAGI